ncbi:GDSL-type esterase/lipase family protein [Amnibacterium sp.]|uniref:GDSL-type esterase/lipase family protein n=1 Tax=Amnibacterium sp. TaxID=1872496 RepID=UPI002630F7EC|nr:GDSL-type esterase/lipase family protein [Amnibacterium sp.]MCU1473184.1 hydrolase family protein [Amnibacterium sp.]
MLGDSIPYNSPDDCPGCTGFVTRYAKAATAALHRPVRVSNLSQHTGLTLPQLLDELATFKAKVAAADIVVVAIAHNSFELNADEPCGAPVVKDEPDWPKLTSACSAASARAARPLHDRLYSTIAAWRAGKPTVLRTLDRYDDWAGWSEHPISAQATATVRRFLDDWNATIAASAAANGFTCVKVHAAINGPDGTRPSGDLLARDYTHPSDAGNARIASALVAEGFAPLAD